LQCWFFCLLQLWLSSKCPCTTFRSADRQNLLS
jgi:hypothetical protein